MTDRWTARAAVDVERALRRQNRQAFGGNPGGRAQVSAPLPAGGQPAGFVSLGSGTLPNATPELLRWRVEATSIVSGGHTVTFDTEVCRAGFADTAPGPGDRLTVQFDGFLIVTVAVFFASHRDGAVVRIWTNEGEADAVEQLTMPAAGFNGTGWAMVSGAACVFRGEEVTVTVEQTSGSAQTADVRLDIVGLRRVLERPVAETGPVIDAIADQTFAEGDVVDLDVTTTGGVAPIQLTASSVTDGLTFTDNGDGTGNLAGTVAVGALDVTTTITATDGAGQEDTEAFDATISAGSAGGTVSLSQIGSVPVNDAFGVAYDSANELCYVAATATDTLSVVDVSDPASPSVIGSVQDGTALNGARGVAYDPAREVCYVAASQTDGLSVVDVSNPASPSVVGSVTASSMNDVRDVAYDETNQRCYMAGRSSRSLTVVDVSTLASPSVVGSISGDIRLLNAIGVAHDGANEVCYVVSANDALVVVDVSNPASPAIISAAPTRSEPDLRVDVVFDSANQRCYVSDDLNDTVEVWDVSNPASPSVIGSVTDATTLDAARGVAYDSANELCYVVTQGAHTGVTAIDVSNPASPFVVDDISGVLIQPAQIAYDASRGLCFVTDSNANGLYVFNVFA